MITLAAAKSYTKKTLDGIGSLQGKDGKSAYQIWLDNGNKGTEQDFLNSLKGAKGDKGDTGATGPKGDTGATGATGPKGTKGDKGDKGDQGIQGLKGDKGDKGEKGDTGTSIAHFWNDTTLTITSASGTSSANLKGEKGDKGEVGPVGPRGEAGKVELSIDKIQSADNGEINANIFYDFGLVTELSLTFIEGDPDKVNEYMFSFTSGETATVLTLPSSIQWVNELTVEPNKRYEVSIVDNIGLWCAVDLVVVAE